ncbi:MAG: hypothetical protein R3Y22_01025 [Bacteroidales bacterium]
MRQNLITIQSAIDNFKALIENAIRTNGVKGKTAIIRSSQPILNIHEAVKSELVKLGVNEKNIFPPLSTRTPELKLAGTMKQKNQDVCIVPNRMNPNSEVLKGGLLDKVVDTYGQAYTERILCINVRSQISSIQKNFDTLYERTYAEAMNLHERCPDMCLGEVYMIAVPEYDDVLIKSKQIGFKPKNSELVEKYIKSFQAINNRCDRNDHLYKYERACLLIVDFSQSPAKIYNSNAELIRDGLLPANTSVNYDGLSFNDFAINLLAAYNSRFKKNKSSH